MISKITKWFACELRVNCVWSIIIILKIPSICRSPFEFTLIKDFVKNAVTELASAIVPTHTDVHSPDFRCRVDDDADAYDCFSIGIELNWIDEFVRCFAFWFGLGAVLFCVCFLCLFLTADDIQHRKWTDRWASE